jgi:hypothetical protein
MTFNSFLKFLPEELNESITIKNSDIPTTLFHYTDGGAVIGMIQNKELWATSVQYMNDPNELHFVIDEVIQYCKFQIEARPEHKHVVFLAGDESHPHNSKENIENEMALNVLEDIIGYLQSRSKKHEQICLISLSENGDLLSQWRAYASNGGYSIGFDTSYLQELAASQLIIKSHHYHRGRKVPFGEYRELYKLLPCIYTKREEQKLYARQAIDNALKFLKENAYQWVLEQETSSEEAYTLMRRLGNEVGEGIIWLSSILKDESFKEEEEWRLVSQPLGYGSLSYRTRGSLVVPYHTFKLAHEYLDESTGKNTRGPIKAIKEVFVGPGSEREKNLSKQTLYGFLNKNDLLIFKSILPIPIYQKFVTYSTRLKINAAFCPPKAKFVEST